MEDFLIHWREENGMSIQKQKYSRVLKINTNIFHRDHEYIYLVQGPKYDGGHGEPF